MWPLRLDLWIECTPYSRHSVWYSHSDKVWRFLWPIIVVVGFFWGQSRGYGCSDGCSFSMMVSNLLDMFLLLLWCLSYMWPCGHYKQPWQGIPTSEQKLVIASRKWLEQKQANKYSRSNCSYDNQQPTTLWQSCFTLGIWWDTVECGVASEWNNMLRKYH